MRFTLNAIVLAAVFICVAIKTSFAFEIEIICDDYLIATLKHKEISKDYTLTVLRNFEHDKPTVPEKTHIICRRESVEGRSFNARVNIFPFFKNENLELHSIDIATEDFKLKKNIVNDYSTLLNEYSKKREQSFKKIETQEIDAGTSFSLRGKQKEADRAAYRNIVEPGKLRLFSRHFLSLEYLVSKLNKNKSRAFEDIDYQIAFIYVDLIYSYNKETTDLGKGIAIGGSFGDIVDILRKQHFEPQIKSALRKIEISEATFDSMFKHVTLPAPVDSKITANIPGYAYLLTDDVIILRRWWNYLYRLPHDSKSGAELKSKLRDELREKIETYSSALRIDSKTYCLVLLSVNEDDYKYIFPNE